MRANHFPKFILVVLMVLSSSLLITGCWDRQELEDRAVILAIAVDKAPKEAEKKEKDIAHLNADKKLVSVGDMVRLTVQIAVPGRIPLGPTQGGGGGSEKPVWVLSAIGHTIDDAISNLQQQVSNQLFFGHLRVIIVGEEYAKTGLENLNDYLRRSSEVRRAAWMVVSKGKASYIINLNPELERVPALYLLSTLDGAVRTGKLPNNFVGVFWSTASSLGQEPYLPYVEVKNEKNILVSGLAYFKGERMVGATKPIEIGYYMAMKSINPGGYTALSPVPETSKGIVMLKSTNRESTIKTQVVNGKPKVLIKTHLEVNILEKNNESFHIKSVGIIKKIEDENKKYLEKSFMDLIKKTQEKGTDIFGFGEYFRGEYPKYWDKQVKTKEKWDEIYKNLAVDIQVDVNIRRVGMKAE